MKKQGVTSIIFIFFISMLPLSVSAQQNINRETSSDFQVSRIKRNIVIPNIPGFLTLKGDFHVHTIFSDGSVSPDFRVIEAWTEGLDIIAITDHIEHRPNKNIQPNDLNMAYNLAKSKAEELNILLVPGAEVTKEVPDPGHFNILFVEDVNKLINDDPMLQVEEAINQGAFIIWNHPGSSWIRPIQDTTRFWDFHTELLTKGWLHGIEVFNTDEWYPIALDWCENNELTVFSNTDIHTPINYWYNLSEQGSHRAMTLVFAEDRSLEAVKDALFNQRTVGFFGNNLVGSEDLLTELFNASVRLKKSFRQTNRNGKVTFFAELENPTDLTFILNKVGDWKNNDRSDIIELMPRSEAIISYDEVIKQLEFQLTNCYYGSNNHPSIQISIVE